MRERFWERFPLDQLSRQEWEALCDGCGRCCLVKLQDEDTDELHFTSLSCRFLDTERCRCTVYEERSQREPDCVRITPALVATMPGLPSTCAYAVLARGEALPPWHPLLTGDRDSVRRAGISVAGQVLSQVLVDEDDYEDYVVRWVD